MTMERGGPATSFANNAAAATATATAAIAAEPSSIVSPTLPSRPITTGRASASVTLSLSKSRTTRRSCSSSSLNSLKDKSSSTVAAAVLCHTDNTAVVSHTNNDDKDCENKNTNRHISATKNTITKKRKIMDDGTASSSTTNTNETEQERVIFDLAQKGLQIVGDDSELFDKFKSRMEQMLLKMNAEVTKNNKRKITAATNTTTTTTTTTNSNMSEHDVICEKGRGNHEQWPGNKLYRHLININKEIYNNEVAPTATYFERKNIITKIMGTIQEQNGWFVISNDSSEREASSSSSGNNCARLTEEKVRKKVADDLRREVRRRRGKEKSHNNNSLCTSTSSDKLRQIKEKEEVDVDVDVDIDVATRDNLDCVEEEKGENDDDDEDDEDEEEQKQKTKSPYRIKKVKNEKPSTQVLPPQDGSDLPPPPQSGYQGSYYYPPPPLPQTAYGSNLYQNRPHPPMYHSLPPPLYDGPVGPSYMWQQQGHPPPPYAAWGHGSPAGVPSPSTMYAPAQRGGLQLTHDRASHGGAYSQGPPLPPPSSVARKGQWTDAEEAIISLCVTNSSEQPFTRWTDLEQQLPGRGGKQIIRDRWVNHLNPNINHRPFSQEDDLLLWEGHTKYGKRWVEISTNSFHSTRSENHIKNRWHSAPFKTFILQKFGPDAYLGDTQASKEKDDKSMTKEKKTNVEDDQLTRSVEV
mmetsp:Transcript_45153/g.52081  ORF Transcript_45153/g.52081 Transcript_45153/m.52081 type:complete len:693 (-) Transcript_45153:10-2088(-)